MRKSRTASRAGSTISTTPHVDIGRLQEAGDRQLNFGRITKQMLDTDDQALWYALNRLMINYWADVDSNGGVQAHEFYLPDALYAVGNNRFEGEQKIRAFYARRQQRE